MKVDNLVRVAESAPLGKLHDISVSYPSMANDITPVQAREAELESEANGASMRHPDSRSSTTLTIFLLSVFILAFFPGTFNQVVLFPFRLVAPLLYSAPASTPLSSAANMAWFQKTFTLPSRGRGSYLIDSEVTKAIPEISQYRVGLLNLFVQHTSCALGMNENWDSDVREDMSDALDRIVPEDRKGTMYRHSAEGIDDMPVRCHWNGRAWEGQVVR